MYIIVKDGLVTDDVLHFVLTIGDLEYTVGRLIRRGVDLIQGRLYFLVGETCMFDIFWPFFHIALGIYFS